MRKKTSVQVDRKTKIQASHLTEQAFGNPTTVKTLLTIEFEQEASFEFTSYLEDLLPRPFAPTVSNLEPEPVGWRETQINGVIHGADREEPDGLLKYLHKNVERANEEYLLLRLKLMKFFRLYGCDVPVKLTDDAIRRVVARIGERNDPQSVDPTQFLYTAAQDVLREHKAVFKQIFPLIDSSNRKIVEPRVTILSKDIPWSKEDDADSIKPAIASLAEEARKLHSSNQESRNSYWTRALSIITTFVSYTKSLLNADPQSSKTMARRIIT